jgi:hypothetical protein
VERHVCRDQFERVESLVVGISSLDSAKGIQYISYSHYQQALDTVWTFAIQLCISRVSKCFKL